jgi:hypothetical protein
MGLKADGSQEAHLNVAGQWTELAASSGWSGRDGAGLLSLDGDLYMLGGWNTAWASPHTTNEVWKSTDDGQTWTQLDDAPWQGRHTAGWLVHDDKLWVLGGDTNSGNYQRDIWSGTPDGLGDIDWVEVSADAAPLSMGRCQHVVFSHAGKMWIVGGQTLDEFTPTDISTKPGSPYYDDVWSSEDGETWTEVSTGNAWAPRGLIIGNAVKDGFMWLIGGGAYDTEGFARVYKNDVWRSADGETWDLITANGGFPPRQYVNVESLNGDLVLAAGWDGANRNDVWKSTNGVQWTEIPDTPWGIRHAASSAVHDGQMLILGGPLTDTSVWSLR